MTLPLAARPLARRKGRADLVVMGRPVGKDGSWWTGAERSSRSFCNNHFFNKNGLFFCGVTLMMCSPRLPAPAPMRPDRCRGGGGDPAGCGAVDLDGIPDVHDGVHHDGPHLHARGTLYPNPPTHTSQNATPYLPRLIISLAPASAACLGSAGQHTHTHTTHTARMPPRPAAPAVDPHRRSLRSVALFTRPRCRP